MLLITHNDDTAINQSKAITKPQTGNEKPHPSTTIGGSKPCVTK